MAFSYPEVGASARDLTEPPDPRYDLDRHRFRVGRGRAAFERAREALFSWRHFDVPWVELHGGHAPARPEQVVATLVSIAGFWFLNPCRVVYVDPGGPDATRAGFGYGTLPGHAERGEERFRVTFSPDGEEVHYELQAFSRPALLATRLAYPFARRVQLRFAESSARALERAIA